IPKSSGIVHHISLLLEKVSTISHTQTHVSAYAYALIAPTQKISGIDFSEENGIVEIVWAANNYHNFTLPAYDTVDYCLIAMSLQINKKTQDTCDAMQTCAVLERKKNIGNEQKLYINDHTHLMQSTSRKKITIF
ncbi:hypothetical protein PSTT_10648, partial [Puccinia striiformis]